MRRACRLCLLPVALLAVVQARAQQPARSVPAAPLAKAEDVGMSAERLARVKDVMQRHVQAGTIPSAVTLVARKGRVVHLEAYGVKSADKSVATTKDTVYTVASLSKPVTAVAALILMEEGKLRLADPVSRFIPEFKGARVKSPEVEPPGTPAGMHSWATKCSPTGTGARWSNPPLPPPAVPGAGGGAGRGAADPGREAQPQTVAASRDITIRDILTHTSGLWSIGVPNPGVPNGDAPGATLKAVVQEYAKVPLDFQPGTKWAYSNRAAFDVLARTIEIVSGQSFDVFLRDRVFVPLGMKDTGFHPQTDARDARLYRAQPLTAIGTSTTFFSGSAGLSTTAEDLWRFAQMLANHGELNGARVLSPSTVEMMATNHVGDLFPGNSGISGCGTGHGLGVVTVQDPIAAGLRVPAGSFGWEGQGTHRFWVVPKEDMVLVMLVPQNGMYVRWDFENAVAQAVIH